MRYVHPDTPEARAEACALTANQQTVNYCFMVLDRTPAIETERLTLRGHQVEDFEDSAAMWGDPEVTRHIGGRPFTREEVWARLLRNVGHWSMLGYGFWVARERTTGRFVGEVGLADFQRDITPSFEGAPEAGWALAPWASGKGFATESVRTILAWADERFPRTVCMIDVGNAASARVAAKCGYREWHQTSYRGTPAVLYERFAQGRSRATGSSTNVPRSAEPAPSR
jgi:RimJ/RimL family protein N-acetyltransferase